MILYRPQGLALELPDNELTYVLPNRESLHCFQSYPARLPEKSLIEWAYDQVLPKGEDLIDIGANVGTWTLYFASKGVHVHAFEPQRSSFQALAAGVGINGLTELVRLHNCGLSNEPGKVNLRVLSEDGGGSSICDLPTNRWPKRTEEVLVVTLDSYALHPADGDQIGLIKIDVEGNELNVIKGGLATLERHSWPKILFEAWIIDWYAQEKEALFAFLKYLGYRVIPITGYCEAFLAEHTNATSTAHDGEERSVTPA